MTERGTIPLSSRPYSEQQKLPADICLTWRFLLPVVDVAQPTNSPNSTDFPPVRYSADITAGSLKPAESRLVSGLLLKGLSGASLDEFVVSENLFKSSRPSTAIRIARLIRKRLEPMGPDLWQLIEEGSGTVCTHALLAAAIHHSRLFADFMDLVVREQHRAFATTLPKRLWFEFLVDCRGRDTDIESWSESTCRKCGTVVYHMLAQTGYINNCRSLELQRVHVAVEVVGYLRSHGHNQVLRCMQVTP